jgi:hypothetical protein
MTKMPTRLRSSTRIAVAVSTSLLLLSACETPYRIPLPNESSARVTVDSKDDVRIDNMNSEGCFRGRSELKDTPSIGAGETAFIEYLGRGCHIYFSFLPEAGKTYRIVGQSFRSLEERFHKRREIESRQGIADERGGLNLYREEGEAGQQQQHLPQLVPIQPQRRVVSALPTCIKLITPEEWQSIRVPPPY